jgi:hypothetical protein
MKRDIQIILGVLIFLSILIFTSCKDRNPENKDKSVAIEKSLSVSFNDIKKTNDYNAFCCLCDENVTIVLKDGSRILTLAGNINSLLNKANYFNSLDTIFFYNELKIYSDSNFYDSPCDDITITNSPEMDLFIAQNVKGKIEVVKENSSYFVEISIKGLFTNKENKAIQQFDFGFNRLKIGCCGI